MSCNIHAEVQDVDGLIQSFHTTWMWSCNQETFAVLRRRDAGSLSSASGIALTCCSHKRSIDSKLFASKPWNESEIQAIHGKRILRNFHRKKNRTIRSDRQLYAYKETQIVEVLVGVCQVCHGFGKVICFAPQLGRPHHQDVSII